MGIAESFGSLPRAAKWGILAAVGIGLYFIAIEPALAVSQRLSGQAASAESRLQALRTQLEARESKMEQLARGLQNHGPVLPPGPVDARNEAIVDLFVDLTTNLNIFDGWRFEPSEAGLSSNELEREFVPAGNELVRLVYAFSFEAPPEDVVELITRLESSPVVQSVSSVRLRLGSQNQRAISAQLTCETWAYRPRGGSR